MNQTIRKELLVQLQHLRSEAKEIGRIYAANLQRDIVQLIDFLNENHSGRSKSSSINQALAQMKETLDGISLKPEKGRRKDLRKIERAVKTLNKIASANKTD